MLVPSESFTVYSGQSASRVSIAVIRCRGLTPFSGTMISSKSRAPVRPPWEKAVSASVLPRRSLTSGAHRAGVTTGLAVLAGWGSSAAYPVGISLTVSRARRACAFVSAFVAWCCSDDSAGVDATTGGSVDCCGTVAARSDRQAASSQTAATSVAPPLL